MDYFFPCDPVKIKLLLKKVGRLGTFNRCRKISREDRNRLIKVFWTKKDKVSLQEIADCFLLTRERVNQIAQELGLAKQHKQSAVFLVRCWAKSLTTRTGNRRFNAVMRKAAREKRFWASRASKNGKRSLMKLRLQPVLEQLGLVEALDSPGSHISKSYQLRVLYPYAWGELRRLGLVKEAERISVVLFYGLGKDPLHYLRREYVEKGKTPERIISVLNRRAAAKGLVTAGCAVALTFFLKKKGIRRF